MGVGTSTEYAALFDAYKKLRSYKEKLQFFDTHFSLVPFSFPGFHPDVLVLLEKEKANLLLSLLDKEKTATDNLFIKKFSVGSAEFLFNITPENSNRLHYNAYILNKFISEDKDYTETIENLYSLTVSESDLVIDRLIDATAKLKQIEDKIRKTKEQGFRYQFMNVFYNGFSDYQQNNTKDFRYKKKFIELYLYAQGILHAKYIEELKKLSFPKITRLKIILPVLLSSVIDNPVFEYLLSDQCFLLN